MFDQLSPHKVAVPKVRVATQTRAAKGQKMGRTEAI